VAGGGPPCGGNPNVLIVVLDDTGFGQLGCYGSAPQNHPLLPLIGAIMPN
jgi:arylsulfatase A-like enzyme